MRYMPAASAIGCRASLERSRLFQSPVVVGAAMGEKRGRAGDLAGVDRASEIDDAG
jgi:hypothetical protein